MKLTHELLVEIIRKLKLPEFDGMCHRFTSVLSQFICGEGEHKFFYYLDKISCFDSPDNLLFAFVQNNNELAELKNFFVEMARYQSPQEDREFWGALSATGYRHYF